MASIQLGSWADLGWAKLGDSSDIEVRGLSILLEQTGEYEIKRDSDFTWYKLKRKNISFFKLVASINQDNYRDEQICQSILSNKPESEIIHSRNVTISEEEVGNFVERIQKADEPLHEHFYRIQTLLVLENYDKLPHLISDMIAPTFFRDYPNGRIYFIVINDLLQKLLAYIRIPYIYSIYGLSNTSLS